MIKNVNLLKHVIFYWKMPFSSLFWHKLIVCCEGMLIGYDLQREAVSFVSTVRRHLRIWRTLTSLRRVLTRAWTRDQNALWTINVVNNVTLVRNVVHKEPHEVVRRWVQNVDCAAQIAHCEAYTCFTLFGLFWILSQENTSFVSTVDEAWVLFQTL
jgi:hypothetical protein